MQAAHVGVKHVHTLPVRFRSEHILEDRRGAYLLRELEHEPDGVDVEKIPDRLSRYVVRIEEGFRVAVLL
jgi:hypothetical protein